MVDYSKRPSTPNTPSAPSGGAPISLSKVTLTKASPSVSLTKGGGASGIMRVNLNWNARPAGAPSGGGFLKRLSAGSSSGAIDLDLGCLFELQSGEKGVIQALGNAFGALQQPPYIALDGDDRSGTNTGGENLSINLDQLDKIKRILVFAYIYEGVPAWDKADGVVTLFPVGGAPIEVKLDEGTGARMCAIAMLQNTGGSLNINREVRYVEGSQSTLDREYGWGMDWRAGRK